MTSRERVLAAFRHEEPDRTPIFEKLIKSPVADDILGRPHAGVNFHYRMQRLADGDWEGLVEQEARDTIDVAKAMGFDMVRLYPNALPGPRPERLDENSWRVGDVVEELLDSGWVRTRPANAAADAGVRPSWTEADDERGLRAWLGAEYVEPTYVDDQWRVFRCARRIIADEGLDLAVFASAYGMPVATLPRVIFEWFVTDRPALHRYYDRCSWPTEALAKALAREGADIVGLGGDLACDHGPMISPRDYREFIAPRIRQQSDAVHGLGAFTTNASDGDLWPLLDHFLLDAGVDGFEEIDYAAGMDLGRLKAAYGDRMCLVGNMDIRFILTRGSVEETSRATIECIEKGRGRGGHVVMSSNCIHENVQLANFLAYVNAYRRYFGLEPVR